MKPRLMLVVLILILAGLACNMPTANSIGMTGTGTPTGSTDVLTLAAATSQAGQTQTAVLQPSSTASADEATPSPVRATNAPPTETPQPCNQALFVQDVTIPDDTRLKPGEAFTKTWRLKNIGTCTWNTGYALVFSGGDAMGAPAVINLPGDVSPNSTVDLSIDMKAPAKTGKYMSNWKLRTSSGLIFGVFNNQAFFAQIQVVAPTPTVTPTKPAAATRTPKATPATTNTPEPSPTPVTGLIYDFTLNMCKAEWRSQAGVLDCPGSEGDNDGYVMRLQNARLETGSNESSPVLLTYPENSDSGAITGRYPAILVQKGYHFQTTIGCLYGATNCNVVYQVNYSIDNGDPENLGQYSQVDDGSIQGIDLDLSDLSGKSVQIILAVVANGSAEQAEAVWVYPRIVKP